MTILEKVQRNLDVAWMGNSLTLGEKEGYFALNDPGMIREVVGQLGPAIHDEEVARHIAQFFRASDAVDGARLEGLSQSRQSILASDRLGEKHSYFGFKDVQATQEALRLLGPSVADETLSGYYEHCLA